MKIIATAVIVLAAVVGLGLLFAYPTMWLVNYLFSASLLQFVFGVSAFTVYKAWVFNAFIGLFRSYSSSKSE